MNAVRLIWAAWRDRPLTTLMHAAMMAVGVAVAVAMLLVSAQVERRLDRDARNIDLVIGAKGSPLQLVMAAVFQIDIPTGNISLPDVDRIAADPRVAMAAPIGLGDAAQGFRIVGADARFLDIHEARIATGRPFEKPMEAVLGAAAARRLGLREGDTFHGSHGLGEGGAEHDHEDFVVVGTLAPTGAVVDRLIVTPLESVWQVHELDTASRASLEATAVLVRTRTPFAAMAMKQEINRGTTMVAARPPEESARLFTLVGAGTQVLRGFAVLLIALAALSVFVSLSATLREQRGDIALLRAMGATRGAVFGVLMGQGVATAFAGAIAGLALGHAALEVFSQFSPQARDLGLTGALFDQGEIAVAVAALGAGVIAALIPAIRAYREDVAHTLQEAS
jgi:putative ABC transport system permease protein